MKHQGSWEFVLIASLTASEAAAPAYAHRIRCWRNFLPEARLERWSTRVLFLVVVFEAETAGAATSTTVSCL